MKKNNYELGKKSALLMAKTYYENWKKTNNPNAFYNYKSFVFSSIRFEKKISNRNS